MTSPVLPANKAQVNPAAGGIPGPLAKIKSIDHVVLTCANVGETARWYSQYLGMDIETFSSPADPKTTQRTALRFGSQKLNLHQRGSEFEPKAAVALPGTADLCFEVHDDTDLEDLAQKLEKEGIHVLEMGQVVGRTGARGPIRSVYVRDPDSNLIELSKYVSG